MATDGPKSGERFWQPDICTHPAWLDIGNLAADEGSYASCYYGMAGYDCAFWITGFGFNVPWNAMITGIKVEAKRHADDAVSIKDHQVSLIKDGSADGANKADTASFWPSSDAVASYGSDGDLWGLAWTPADVNSEDFGVMFSAESSLDGKHAYVDGLKITVYYVIPQSQNRGGNTFANIPILPAVSGWSNPSNAQYNDPSSASILLDAKGVSYYLRASNFGFNLPSDAEIEGIEVGVYKNASAIDSIVDYGVFLTKAGGQAVKGIDESAYWPSSSTKIKYGGNLNLWQSEWSTSDINGAGFGVYIAAKNQSGQQASAYIDYFEITVYYTLKAVCTPSALTATITLNAPSCRYGFVAEADHGVISAKANQADVSVLSEGYFREKSAIMIAPLVDIEPKNNGPRLLLSDREIVIEGQRYEDYIIGVQEIFISAPGDERATVKIKNARFGAYNRLYMMDSEYPLQGAICTISEVYIEGASISEPLVLMKGVIDEITEISETSFTISLISPIEFADRTNHAPIIDSVGHPNAFEDLGKPIPTVYGSNILMPALRTDWGARTTLKTAISSIADSLEVSDGSRLPSYGHVWIDNEKIGYTSRGVNVLYGCQRAVDGTKATVHRAGAEVWEHKAEYESLLACHELSNVGEIYAEINGRLYRVDSGVSQTVKNGMHYIAASEQVRVQSLNEDLDVTNPTHEHKVENSVVVQNVGQPVAINASAGGVSYTTISFAAYSGEGVSSVYKISLAVTRALDAGSRIVIVASCGNESRYVLDCFTSTMALSADSTIRLSFSVEPRFNSISIYRYAGANSCGTLIQSVDRLITVRSLSQPVAPNVARKGDIVSTHFVERFHAVVSGIKDTEGFYGGVGAVIERPDAVIKHILVKRAGIGLSEIDTKAFSGAGWTFTWGGYGFGFLTHAQTTTKELLNRLADECRARLRCSRGKWRLDYISDVAPVSVMTITDADMISPPVFRLKSSGLSNDIKVLFNKSYSTMPLDSKWDAMIALSDNDSKTKFGTFPKTLEFDFVRSGWMAEDVLRHKLAVSKKPLHEVKFSIGYRFFSLCVGDVVTIESGLLGQRQYVVSSVRRVGWSKAEVEAVEHW